MDSQRSLDFAICIVISTLLFFASVFLMNVGYRFVLGVLLGLNGVFAYLLLFGQDDWDTIWQFRFERIIDFDWTILLHALVILFWLFVPAATTLFFASWGGMPLALLLRGILTLVYATFVPGVALTRFLDSKRQLTLLEVTVLGSIFSIFFLSFGGYLLFTANLSLTSLLFPVIWMLTTILLIAGKARHKLANDVLSRTRPQSVPTRLTAGLLSGTLALFLVAILAINITWGAPIGGDLWTHLAQAAYFTQGYNTVTYPWGYHFLLDALWAVTGLPIANVGQLLQSLTVLPILGLFIATAAYSGPKSKVPPLAMLFYTVFMGLGWIPYIYLRSAGVPTSPASLYNLEYQASAFMYDITIGVFNFRAVFLPETVAITSLILGIRLLRGFTMTNKMILISAMIVTFTSMTSHIFETSFFVVILAIAAFLRAHPDYLRTILLSELGAGGAFILLYLVDYLSPEPQRIFTSSPGNLYFLGFIYPVYALTFALSLTLIRMTIARKNLHKLDLLEWIYSKWGKTVSLFEDRLIQFTVAITMVLGVVFGLYKMFSPPVYAWETLGTGQVPLVDYPLRLGIVTFFVILGGVIIVIRRDSFRDYFEFFALAAVAVVVARTLDLFGPRPLGFGEYRVMDILWVASAPLAAYGMVELTRKSFAIVKMSQQRRKIVGAILILLVIFTGASSFMVFIDAKIVLGLTPGYVATSDDLLVMNYILTHRSTIAGLVTSPTVLSQYKIRALSLTFPPGYFDSGGVLPFFFSDSIGSVITLSGTLTSLKIFLSGNDVSVLSSQYQPVLWYLAYQPAIFDAATSFLLSPIQLEAPSSPLYGPTIVLDQNDTVGAYFGVSAFALTKTSYSLNPDGGNLPLVGSTAILTSDPADQRTFSDALSWVSSAKRTLVVVAAGGSPGLFESQLIKMKHSGTSFIASRLSGQNGNQSSQIDLPYPVPVENTDVSNGTVSASFVDGSSRSPLAVTLSVGAGRVLFLSLRDYYLTLTSNMFADEGRGLYNFLPSVFWAAGVPLNP